MVKKAFVVTGLGYGDEGKGHTVHWLASKYKAHTVVRTGGPQAFHRVVSSSGKEHVHAQFGSGTLAGAATHLSKHMIIDPYAIISEGKALIDEHGIKDVFERLTIHQDALVITPFQAIANRLRELTRGSNRRGSVGVGVGETVRDSETYGEISIRAEDLNRSSLKEKLKAIQNIKIIELRDEIGLIEGLPPEARERARLELNNLKSSDTVDWAVGWFRKLASMVEIVDTDYLAAEILNCPGTVVFEGSQGVLLDRYYGFHPYTTKVRTTPETALAPIKECNYDGEIESLGVLRAYHTRHGSGPFVAESNKLTTQLPDASNADHIWQGKFRVGCFDMVLAKYAIEVCEEMIDSLVVTCVDRIAKLDGWDVCHSYYNYAYDNFINIIPIDRRNSPVQLKYQKGLSQLFSRCFPITTTYKKGEDIIKFCPDLLMDRLNIPVSAISIGPTEKDCIEFKDKKTGQTA